MQERIRECLERFRLWKSAQLQRTHWQINPRMHAHYKARAQWLAAREKYLEEEYKRHGRGS